MGFGRRFEGGIWTRRVAAAVKSKRATTRPSKKNCIVKDALAKVAGCDFQAVG